MSIAILLIGTIFILILVGVPVFASLGLAGIASLFALPSTNSVVASTPLLVVSQSIYTTISFFPLFAIPFFILAGEIMNRGGLTDKLIRFALLLIGRAPASLAQANIVSSVLFGGMNGSAQADTSCIGSVLIPAMIKEGYGKAFSAAVTAASSVCAPLIPPSIMLIIYGVTVNASIGALFMGGLLPGVMIGISLMIVVAIMNTKHRFPRRTERLPAGEKIRIIGDAILPLGLPVIIVYGIRGGVVTPTEAGAIAVAYSLFVCMLILRTVKIADLYPMLLRAASMSACILLIIACAKIIGYGLTVLQVPVILGKFFLSVSESPYVFLLLVNLLLLIMGMFMDGAACVVVLAPILTPIAMSLGIDPVHFGLVMVLNMVIGTGTPPLGVCLFIACNIARIPFEQGAKAILPFLVAEISVLMLITYLPDVALFLPKYLGYM